MNKVLLNNKTVTEYSVNQMTDCKQPGKIFAWYFIIELEAQCQLQKYQGAGAYQETRLS